MQTLSAADANRKGTKATSALTRPDPPATTVRKLGMCLKTARNQRQDDPATIVRKLDMCPKIARNQGAEQRKWAYDKGLHATTGRANLFQLSDASSGWDKNLTNNGDACNFQPVWGQATNGRSSAGTTGWGGGQWSKAQPGEGASKGPTKGWGSFSNKPNAGETGEAAPTAGTSNGWARPKWGQSKASTDSAGQIGSGWGAISKGGTSNEGNDDTGNSGNKQEPSAPAQPDGGPRKGWGSLSNDANIGPIGGPTDETSNGWARPKWGQGKPSKDSAGHNRSGWDAIRKGDAQSNKENSGSGNSNKQEHSAPGSDSTEVVSITQTEVCDTGCKSNGNSTPKPNASDRGWGAGGEDNSSVPADDTGEAGADLAQPEQDNDALDTPQQDQRDTHSAGCEQNANGWSKPAASGWGAGKSNGWGNKASGGGWK
eukprot:jgi/Chlat1/1640/Chrsp127S01883